jgi:hypothetical protein
LYPPRREKDDYQAVPEVICVSDAIESRAPRYRRAVAAKGDHFPIKQVVAL